MAKPMPPLTQDAVEKAAAAARRVSNRPAPIRQSFIRSNGGELPPMTMLLRGGRSGGVRLKLLLSIIWVAARAPHETNFPARGWAELLNLDDPARRGARRITDAIEWLENRRLLRTEKVAGHPSTLYLLDEDGTGRPYRHPGSINERYVKLPATFWTNGWIATLTGSEVALFLALYEQDYFRKTTGPFWVAPKLARDLYGLSTDTWTEAGRGLSEKGLIQIGRKPVSDDDFGWARVRNTFLVDARRLDQRAGPVVAPTAAGL